MITAVALVQIFVGVAAFLWLLLADKEKTSYLRNRAVVALALLVVNVLALIAILETFF